MCVRVCQLCNSRHPHATINCCHIVLTLWETLDSSYNPLNLVGSSLKRSVVELVEQTEGQTLKIMELNGEIFALKIRLRNLKNTSHFNEIQSENQKISHHYEWMLPTGSLPNTAEMALIF